MEQELSHYLSIIEKLELNADAKFLMQIELIYAYALKHYPDEIEQTLNSLQGNMSTVQSLVSAVKTEYEELGIAGESALAHVISKLEGFRQAR